ncbi:MAG: 16S rRNA (cytosine(1402)-N(4))-methyltransferase RsmH [Phycisphaerae bacterium]
MASDNSLHIPVLTQPLVELLVPSAYEVGIDCTLGFGGHARAILEHVGSVRLIGMDMDPSALGQARANLSDFSERITFIQSNFAQIGRVLGELDIPRVDFIYADLGVSSMQLEEGKRGFSFQHDGPLDMRMDPDLPRRAADLVNSLKEQELADLIFRYGEEGRSKKIANLIIQARRSHRIDSTGELAGIVCQALGVDAGSLGRQRLHPATRTFQALRIAVNDELGNLERLLRIAPSILNPKGRIGVISFHSLEDRLVKEDFRTQSEKGIYRVLTAKPIEAKPEEILRNPRSRSGKLRVAQNIL